jgi:hypothetical protein
MRAAVLVLLAAACTEHGSGGLPVCDGLTFTSQKLATPASVSQCMPQIPGDPDTYYASCSDFANLGSDCIAPDGFSLCFDTRRTTLCTTAADCPTGFACDNQFGRGLCEKTCDSDLDCVRCDLRCDLSVRICREGFIEQPPDGSGGGGSGGGTPIDAGF